MTANGPLPTTLVFLNDLPSLPRGAKVRFLGWYAFFFLLLASCFLFLVSCIFSLFSFVPPSCSPTRRP